MTPQQLKDLRTQHRLTARAFGSVIGVTERTVLRWEHGDSKPSAQTIELLLIKLSNLSYGQHLEAGEKEGVGSCKECGND